MEEHTRNFEKFKVIDCEGIHVAASVETTATDNIPIYYPATMLVYVEQGQMNLRSDNQVYSLSENEFGLIRKYTYGTYFKTWNQNQNGFKDHIFILHDEFIREVIGNFEKPKDFMPYELPMIKIPTSTILEGLMSSVKVYLNGEAQIDRNLIRLKTYEALYAISKSNPNLLHIFNEFSTPERADLVKFIEHNYTHKVPLEELAKMSGRSLSTFNRDFKKTYKTSPHKWIKKQRLELAKKILLNTPRKPSDVYLEVGFEDLAHFSKSFKSYFGKNPSEISALSIT